MAVPVGLVTSLALTWSSTHAAFSASTGNADNSWQTGSVVLADSDSGSALFTSTSSSDGALKPGSSRSRCIRLDYTGSLQADIRMYVGTPAGGATALDPYLLMSVERGTDVDKDTEVKADCTGFAPTGPATFLDSATHADAPSTATSRTLGHLRAQHRDHDTGIVVNPATAPNTYMTLRITYVLKDEDGAQSKQSAATFTWEARNT
ncbi:hypothetical protein ACU610_23860 [Geodermatophilus sp. URMC 61]|uniref:hypothetical protein n=1 Tax=Geodermatophilus sp. URMC 61 TaxID=3423411 RepID=UPI00406CF316